MLPLHVDAAAVDLPMPPPCCCRRSRRDAYVVAADMAPCYALRRCVTIDAAFSRCRQRATRALLLCYARAVRAYSIDDAARERSADIIWRDAASVIDYVVKAGEEREQRCLAHALRLPLIAAAMPPW